VGVRRKGKRNVGRMTIKRVGKGERQEKRRRERVNDKNVRGIIFPERIHLYVCMRKL